MGDRDKIQWHSAFQQAMRVELAAYQDELEFISEYALTTEPLRIDTLIIKKAPGARIEKNIGRIFRGHNIVEYKSPKESLSFEGYHKAFAYAYLYGSLARIRPDDMTITLVTSKRPRELLRDLRAYAALKIAPVDRGIHSVAGERMPVQIIESKALPEEENLWLNALRGNLEKETLKRLINESGPRGGDVRAYMHVVLEANEKTLRGDVDMGNWVKALSQNPGFADEFERLVSVGRTREKNESAKRMLRRGANVTDVAHDLELPLERVREIRREVEKEQKSAALS